MKLNSILLIILSVIGWNILTLSPAIAENLGEIKKNIEIEKSIEQKAAKKCNAKDASECYSLGSYFQSQGRLAQASLFYLKGCDLKNNWSCDAAGKLEVKKGNLEKGRMLLNKACDNGYDEACSYLIQIKNEK